jgi:hypothetical protein
VVDIFVQSVLCAGPVSGEQMHFALSFLLISSLSFRRHPQTRLRRKLLEISAPRQKPALPKSAAGSAFGRLYRGLLWWSYASPIRPSANP